MIAYHISQINLGQLENIFFYLVLDNVKALFKLERQKKVMEKLAICQASIQPTCFSILVINDALCKEIDVFFQHTNAFAEYMFSPFYFSPMPREQIERLMCETLKEMYLCDESKANFPVDALYLETVFPDFFSMLHQTVSVYTVTVNEYAYLCLFLYPHYMERVYQEHAKLRRPGMSKEQNAQVHDQVADLVKNRGLRLSTKTFRALLQECLSNLYIHSTSKEDILRNVEERQIDA